jgi:hypothetical protein
MGIGVAGAPLLSQAAKRLHPFTRSKIMSKKRILTGDGRPASYTSATMWAAWQPRALAGRVRVLFHHRRPAHLTTRPEKEQHVEALRDNVHGRGWTISRWASIRPRASSISVGGAGGVRDDLIFEMLVTCSVQRLPSIKVMAGPPT